jgi:hypothetical protein
VIGSGADILHCTHIKGAIAMDSIFRWNGEYFGFVRNGRLFDANARYLGWIDDDGSVWRADGSYLGQVVEGEYILRNSIKVQPADRAALAQPMSPMAPMAKMNRMGKMQRMSFVDALDDFPAG